MFLTTPSSTWPSDRLPIRRVRSSARVSSMTARRDTTMLPRRRSILRMANCWAWPISGPTSHTGLAARQEGHGAAEIDGEAAFDAAEYRAHHAFLVGERLLELGPGFLAARLVARQNRFALFVLHAVDEDVDDVAFLDLVGLAVGVELAQCHAAFGLEADIDHREIVGDANDHALDD